MLIARRLCNGVATRGFAAKAKEATVETNGKIS